jgi:alkylhydroperoxidase family enzyme
VSFADSAARDQTVISDTQVQRLFEEFTAPQIVELLIWISFECTGQRFGCLIGNGPASAEEKQSAMRSR